MSRRSWPKYWAARCRLNSSMSTCRTRQVGAVAVVGNRSIADGFNGNIPGAEHCDEGGCARCADTTYASGTRLDLCTCVHAEANLIALAARRGIVLVGSTLWCTHRPCHECFKLVVSAGVLEILYLEDYPATYPVPTHVRIERAPSEAFDKALRP